MLNYAREQLGIDRIATGHYARIDYDKNGDRYQLKRAADRNKDQSYFLYDLTQDLLAGTLFPLGEVLKTETRQIANQYELKTADKPESQDLCLVEATGSMQAFLDKYITGKKGDIIDTNGQVLGKHDGIHHYTIGQRKGLGISAPNPLYVVGIDPGRNQVIVGDRESAVQTECTIKRVNWVSISPPNNPIRAQVQIRYRSQPEPVTVIPINSPEAPGIDPKIGSCVKLIFDEPIFGITPGQAAVWYDGDLVLGGGIIDIQK
jgi:tRNA-specific 2-thiouridylase